MSNDELLRTLVGPVAGDKLAGRYRSLRELASTHPMDLRDAGITSGAVDKLAAVFEVARRYGETQWEIGSALLIQIGVGPR